jgi:hypothetical protein
MACFSRGYSSVSCWHCSLSTCSRTSRCLSSRLSWRHSARTANEQPRQLSGRCRCSDNVPTAVPDFDPSGHWPPPPYNFVRCQLRPSTVTCSAVRWRPPSANSRLRHGRHQGRSRPAWATTAGCHGPAFGLGRPPCDDLTGPAAAGPAARPHPTLGAVAAVGGDGGRRRRSWNGDGGDGVTDMFGNHRNDSDYSSWACWSSSSLISLKKKNRNIQQISSRWHRLWWIMIQLCALVLCQICFIYSMDIPPNKPLF